MNFKDRNEAGELLAERLFEEWKESNPVIEALTRGGVPVAYPISKKLNSDLDILVVGKIGAPSNPEFALGAVTEDQKIWINREALSMLSVDQTELDQLIQSTIKQIKNKTKTFRNGRPPIDIQNRPVILVDDGLATGSTLLAAVSSLKSRGASMIVVAVPVASQGGMKLVKAKADQVVSLYEPQHFFAVGEWYQDFSQVSDEEVVQILERSRQLPKHWVINRSVKIQTEDVELEGELSIPNQPKAWILFAHGSGSSRLSPRNLKVSKKLNEAGFATLLFDLLNLDESQDREKVFDIELLSYRLFLATKWLKTLPEWKSLPIGYFGASTGAAAALQAAALFEPDIYSIVSRGGRPDLVLLQLDKVTCPVLLIVGGEDFPVIEMNRKAYEKLSHAKLEIVPLASHLFEEPGALEKVIELSIRWFNHSLDQLKKHKPKVA